LPAISGTGEVMASSSNKSSAGEHYPTIGAPCGKTAHPTRNSFQRKKPLRRRRLVAVM